MSQPYGYSSLATGQVSVTSAAAQLPANPASEVVLSAAKANSASVYVGPTGVTDATGLEIPPGSSVRLKVANLAMLWAITSSTATLSWAALY